MSARTIGQETTVLYDAEILFKMAFAMHQSPGRTRFNYLEAFSWGRHILRKEDLELTRDEEDRAMVLFQYVSTYTLAAQIDTCLQDYANGRFDHRDEDIRGAAWIARLIRNAFAHNPFRPQWKIYHECENKNYAVKDIITVDTKNLNGKSVTRSDYGGPLAMLRLSEYVRGLTCEESGQIR